MKLQAYPYDATYKIVDGKAELRFFCRKSTGERICLIDRNFAPYFYVEVGSFEELRKEVGALQLEKGKIISMNEVQKQFLGDAKTVVKVTVDTPPTIPSIAREIQELQPVKQVYESDIRFVQRYLVDKRVTPLCLIEVEAEPINRGLKVPCYIISSIIQVNDETLPEPRVLALDIETYAKEGEAIMPEKQPITMISFYGKDFSKVLSWKRFKTTLDYIEFVDNEAALIRRTVEILEQFKPEFITGYNSDGFDLPYINTRAQKYNIELNIGLDGSSFFFSQGFGNDVYIRGIVHIDMYRFIKQTFGRTMKTDSFTLDAVAEELLGEKKHKVDVRTMWKAWDTGKDIEKFAAYNLQDSVLTYKLFTQLWANLEEFVKLVGLFPLRITRAGFSQLVEGFIMKQTPYHNQLIPNKPSYGQTVNRANSRFTGAFVHEPTPGLYKDISVMDFASLYPTIIVSHNVSPGTLHCTCCDNSKNAITSGKNKYWFCERRKGFVAQILEEIITRRMRVKEMMKETSEKKLLSARSEALKLLSNSVYGYLGFSAARWYCFECADATTAFARSYIKDVMKKAEEAGYTVIYGDTDSIFITTNGKEKNTVVQFVESINADLPGLMELEHEYNCNSGIFVASKHGGGGAKKRYALLKDDGNMEIRGFEVVRRNVSEITREVQKKVLDLVLHKSKPDEAIAYVKNVIKDLRDKKIDVNKVIIRTKLSRPLESYETKGPHVAAARLMKAKGIDVQPGMRIEYIVSEGEGKISDRVCLSSEQCVYDAEYYISHQIVPAVEQILQVFGVGRDELLKNYSQKTLVAFR